MTTVAWAKYAADDIVSDDDIDEAEAKKSDSRDWLKWALGIGVLGAGAYGVYANRDAIKQALGGSLFTNRNLSNRVVDKATGGIVPGIEHGVTESPIAAGAMVGGLAASTAGGRLSKLRALGGNQAEHQTLDKISDLVSQAPSAANRGKGPGDADLHVAQSAYDTLKASLGGNDKSHEAFRRAYLEATANPNHPLAKLVNYHDGGPGAALAPDVGTEFGSNRRTALQQTSNIVNNSGLLGKHLLAPVTYTDPTSGAPVSTTLGKVPEAHIPLLSDPDQQRIRGLHHELGKSFGIQDTTTFDPNTFSSGLSKIRNLAGANDWGHIGRRAVMGGVGGAVLGAGVDALAGN